MKHFSYAHYLAAIGYLVLSLTSCVCHDLTLEPTEGLRNLEEFSPKAPPSFEKEWLVVVYMAADNDLELFSRRNLAQLMTLGSNDNAHFLVQLDTKIPGGKKITKRYYVEKNKLIITNKNQTGMDSGDAETLIDCMRWASGYKARHVMVIFWNHGTGIIDIGKPKGLNTSALFSFNPFSNLIELDRSIPFLFFAAATAVDPKGICFDDTTGNYLNNQKLEYALDIICTKILKKKIDIIGFDACLMSMLEMSNIVRDYAHFMVSSQEVELGTGWDYQLAFGPLSTQRLSPLQLATHIVKVYETAYLKITPDYTQSALDLSRIKEIEENVNRVSQTLLLALLNQHDSSALEIIKTSRHSQFCTHFDEPSYIDLHHFYSNLLSNLSRLKLKRTNETKGLHQELRTLLQQGLAFIKKAIVANVTGKNLKNATGISIYFPERIMHPSYRHTKFALNNTWFMFLNTMLLA